MVKKGWWKSRLFPNKNWQVGSPALWNCKIRYIILVFQQQKWGISGQWVLLEHTPGNCYSRLYLSCRYQAYALNHGILGICFMKSLDQQQKYFWNVIVLQEKVNWAWKNKLQEGTLISFVVGSGFLLCTVIGHSTVNILKHFKSSWFCWWNSNSKNEFSL